MLKTLLLEHGSHMTFTYNFTFFKVDCSTMQTNKLCFYNYGSKFGWHSKWRRLFFDVVWCWILQYAVMHGHQTTAECCSSRISTSNIPSVLCSYHFQSYKCRAVSLKFTSSQNIPLISLSFMFFFPNINFLCLMQISYLHWL
jgi:hypothetical protein